MLRPTAVWLALATLANLTSGTCDGSALYAPLTTRIVVAEQPRRAGLAALCLAVADLAATLGAAGREAISSYDKAGLQGEAMSFGELEDMWATELLPELRTYACMRTEKQEPPAKSRWRHNWDIPEPR